MNPDQSRVSGDPTREVEPARAGEARAAGIEVDAIDLVHAYVAEGFGIGLSVRGPGVGFPKGVKVVPLKGFPEMTIAGMWRGRIHPLAGMVLDHARRRFER